MLCASVPFHGNVASQSCRQQSAQPLQTIGTPLIVVAGTKAVPLSDINTGIYKHLGISADADLVSVPDGPVLPIGRMGKWSMRNRQGWERVRRDLPKITKTYTWETPNFGDASTYGTHIEFFA